VARAEEDYGLARIARRHKPPFCYGACFHAQQCADKYLKAALVARGQPFPKTHDLLPLNDLCDKAGIILGMRLDQLSILSSYAVRVRYPGDDPTLDEAREALKIAKAVRRFVRQLLGLK
jgi:HEPN domain-containing protein